MKYYAGARVLQPGYMREFACIGPECADNCCRGHMEIDKDTYALYKALPDSEFKRKILGSTELSGKANPAVYARTICKASEPCPFLLDSGLCQIHARQGEEYLSPVCYTVPRKVIRLGDSFEKSLRLFCAEACRLVLLSPEVMEFDSFRSDESAKLFISADLPRSRAERIQPAWFAVRSAFIDILQDRRLGFGHRMLLAGLAAEELEKLNAGGAGAAQVVEFLGGLSADYASELAVSELSAILHSDASEFTSVLVHMLDKLVRPMVDARDSGLARYARLCAEGLGFAGGTVPAEAVARYACARAGYLRPYFADRHVYEQYFVNAFFGRAFPLRNRKSLLEEFMILALQYFLIDVMLAGIAAALGGIGDTIIIDFIHRFAKVMEYTPAFEEMMGRFIVSENLKGIGAIMAMTVHDCKY